MINKKTVTIIGGGFCGMMTAVHLINQQLPVNIIIINDGYAFGKGVAYSAHTKKYLLNVRAINMSAFEQDRHHFLNWLHQQKDYEHVPENILANVYAPRQVYGNYLQHVWEQALQNKHPQSEITIIQQKAKDVFVKDASTEIVLKNDEIVKTNLVVLATGNTAPRPLSVHNKAFLNSEIYCGNPWDERCVMNAKQLDNILIVGNGLTMIDTLLGLLENGFKGKIYTVSPNGFKLIPHKYNLLVYDEIMKELPDEYHLDELFVLVRKHIKSLTQIGIGSHLVIDALRPHTQKIWQLLSIQDKNRFVKRFSHAWTILRHRLPMHIYELVQQLKLQNKLETIAGRIIDIEDTTNAASVTIYNNKTNKEEKINVGRVINCTGPESNIQRSANELLKNMSNAGLIQPDALFLGIEADVETGAVINSKKEKSVCIFTVGGNLKGMLWESTAVPDIRIQTEKLALHLANRIKQNELMPV